MTKAQERAAARRRFEKQQAAAAQRAADRSRTRRAIAVVAVVLVLVAGFVFLARQINPSSTPELTAAGCPAPPSSLGTGAKLTLPDKAAVAGKTYVATVSTNCGDITMELDGTKAPQAVASFQQLAQVGYWLNSACHRLTTSGIFVLQCGDPTGTGQGAPGYGFAVENPPANDDYPRGTLAMARTNDVKAGNGGQFFIVYKDTKIEGGYTIFGKVLTGMDIVDRIAAAGTAADGTSPAAPISILRVTLTEKKA